MSGPSRRDVLRGAGATVVLGAAGAGTTGCSASALGSADGTQGSSGRVLPSLAHLPPAFHVPLPIPPVLEPTRTDGRTDYYDIVQKPAEVEILPGLRTGIWGYAGRFPGPTVETRTGRTAVVTHHNRLPVPTVVHLHGARIAPEHDGFPTDYLLPDRWPESGGHGHAAMDMGEGPGGTRRGSRDYVYDLDQPAATLWYHDHRMDFTGPSVWRGLAGFHLHRDDVEERLGLPSGEREIPLMIADRSFTSGGALRYPALDRTLKRKPGVSERYMAGVLGDVILVNGAPWPVHEVAATTYRLRILNASNARRYRLALKDGPDLVQIGSDQGLLSAPVRHREFELAQAERVDVVVDFSDRDVGDEITLVNRLGSGRTARVMRFRVGRKPRGDERPTPLPARLARVERLELDDAVRTRTFRLQRREREGMPVWTINDQEFSSDRPLARPELGTVERWIIRGTDAAHPFHIHLAPFQVLQRGSTGEPGAFNAGWKDTVNLDEGFRADILIRFDGHRGRYVFHCHNLEHEDMRMMAAFEVV